MSVELSLALLGVWTLLVAGFGAWRYRTPLNPLTLFACSAIGIFTLGSGAVVAFILPGRFPASALSLAAIISTLYLAGVLLPYLFRGPLPAQLFGKFLSVLGLNSQRLATRFSFIRFFLLLLGAVAALFLVAVIGGGGSFWLTHPRWAYQEFRAGVGLFWLMAQWFLVFAWMYYLWSRRPRALETGLMLGLFCFLAYFTGSKNNILILGVVAVVYYNFLVKPIRVVVLAGLALSGLVAMLGLLVLQGSFADLVLALAYFDYYGTTAHFLARFDEFGFQLGKVWLSSFWFFVPRALYPDKPFEYGATLLHGVLFPGAAEAGHTPGFLAWTPAYLDFGAVGVFALGALQGFWQRMAYEHFFRSPSFFSFFFMIHLSLWPVMAYAPLTLALVWSVAQALLFRMVWRKIPVRDALPWPIEQPSPVAR